MRLHLSVMLALAAAGVLLAQGPAIADIHSDKQIIQGIYDRCDSAADQKDTKGALSRYGDPQLREYESATLGQLLGFAQSPHFSTEIVAISRPGKNPNEAVTVVKQHFAGFIPRQQGGIQLVTYDAELREYWIKVGGKWQTERTRLLSVARTKNGQSVKAW